MSSLFSAPQRERERVESRERGGDGRFLSVFDSEENQNGFRRACIVRKKDRLKILMLYPHKFISIRTGY
jgi:hypothetical protein